MATGLPLVALPRGCQASPRLSRTGRGIALKYVLNRRVFVCGLAGLASNCAWPALALASSQASPGSRQFTSPAIEFGVDYYAEDWPPERVEIDAALMERAKFRTVRLLDTNWERVEPQEGRFDFAWLDRVIDILNRHNMRVVLGTSSYVPPAWLGQKHPEFFLVEESGARRHWGGMGFMCLNNPQYLGYVEKLVTALAQHYGRHPGVIGWQIDNEMGTWGSECYDPDYCVPKFREHLRRKFGSIEELNRRLLTVSYGHRYSDWDQIQLRSRAGEDALQVPLLMEGRRFFSSNIADFLAFQARILRANTKGQFISHNANDPGQNCFEFARPLDFLSMDLYPLVGQYTGPAFGFDLWRGANHGRSFLMLEQRSGTFGDYTLKDATPPPGLARLWAWQSLAHGADGILFFRWRRNNGGSEQYWQGLLDYAGSPTRAYDELSRMGAELERIGQQFSHAESRAQVAMLISYDSMWALDIGPRNFPYLRQHEMVSHSFRRLGLNTDVVDSAADFSRYKVIAAPSLHMVDPATVTALQRFVDSGGILILTARSGMKNPDNLATELPPGPLHPLAKVWVRETTTLAAPDRVGAETDEGAYQPAAENGIRGDAPDWPQEYRASGWIDVLDPDGAQVLFRYTRDYYAGRPAVTVAEHGKGKAVYVGALLEPAFYFELAKRVSRWAGLDSGIEIPEGMDCAVRTRGGKHLRFLLNFSAAPQAAKIPGAFQDLLTGDRFAGLVRVPALDLRILEETRAME